MIKRSIQVGGAILSGLNVAVPLLLDLKGLFPTWSWQCHAIIGFTIFIVFMCWILWDKQKKIDEYEEQINIIAYPSSYSLNWPVLSMHPLKLDEISIQITAILEIWTTINLNTAHLVMNVIGISSKQWWKPFTRRKLSFAIRMEGHDNSVYRKQIMSSDAQPFQDTVTFKWKGKREAIQGEDFTFELAMQFGSPNVIKRVNIDINQHMQSLRDRGNTTTPL